MQFLHLYLDRIHHSNYIQKTIHHSNMSWKHEQVNSCVVFDSGCHFDSHEFAMGY